MPPLDTKRLVPFPLVLFAIVGTFVLIALYADVRGREQRAAQTPAPAAQEETVPAPMPEPAAATSTDAQPEQQAPEPLGLQPESPTSNVPAAAVFDCWRYEWRGDRLIVDRDYRHIAGDGIEPMIGPNTAHLRCKGPQYALRSEDGSITVYWSTGFDSMRPASIDADTLYRIDPLTGELQRVALVEYSDAQDVELLTLSHDARYAFLRTRFSQQGKGSLYRVDLTTSEVRTFGHERIWGPLFLMPDQNRAVGFEYTPGHPIEQRPVFLHRINLENGQRVRTKEITDVFPRGQLVGAASQPVFIDDQRFIAVAEDDDGSPRSAVVVNAFTGATRRLSAVSGLLPMLALTVDGSALYTFSDEMPLTAIPVSELPKP